MRSLKLDQIRPGDRFFGHGDDARDADARVCNRGRLRGTGAYFTVEPEGGDWFVVEVHAKDCRPDGTVPGFYRLEEDR